MANISEVVTFVREVKHSVLYKGRTIMGFYIPKEMLEPLKLGLGASDWPETVRVTISSEGDNNG